MSAYRDDPRDTPDPWEGRPYDPRMTPPLAAAPRTIPLEDAQRLDPLFGQPAPRSIRRMQAPDLLADESDTSDETFGDLGQFGFSSVELPVAYPQAAWERQRWAAEQKARVASARKIDLLYQKRVLSGPAFDLLQLEFSDGYVPVIELHGASGWYRVWSAAESRWYSLDGWERRAQSLLAVSDPDRQTAVLTRHALPTGRPWAPELDSGFRATPPPMPRPTPPIGPIGRHAPHSRPLPPEWRGARERRDWEG